MPVSPCPADMRWVNPYLSVRDVGKIIAFYQQAFGFEVKFSMQDAQGKTVHAELMHYDCTIMVGTERPERGDAAPHRLGGTTVTLYVYTPDVDSLAARAQEAGARIVQPPEDQFWGDRVCILDDPEGHRWSFATHVRNVSPEEIQVHMG